MRLFTKHLLISLSMICNNSCNTGTSRTKKLDPPSEALVKSDVLVGRVASVYLSKNYMLIQKYRNFATDIDVIFYSRGSNGTVHALKMTEQKLGQFYIADLSDGIYTVNDPVFMRDLGNSTQARANQAAGTP